MAGGAENGVREGGVCWERLYGLEKNKGVSP